MYYLIVQNILTIIILTLFINRSMCAQRKIFISCRLQYCFMDNKVFELNWIELIHVSVRVAPVRGALRPRESRLLKFFIITITLQQTLHLADCRTSGHSKTRLPPCDPTAGPVLSAWIM